MPKKQEQRKGRRELAGTEDWREYDFDGRVYRINDPQAVYVGGTTHVVVDADGVAHCVPAPGVRGCVLRWSGNVVF